MAWMPTFLENRCNNKSPKISPFLTRILLQKCNFAGLMWYSLGTTLSLAMLRVTRRSLKESLGILRFRKKEFEIYRLCLGFKTLQVHDIVADPIGRYDMILSRHTLQVIVFFGWCVLFSVSFVDHDPPTAFENWRCGASHCKLCKKRINFPSNYKLPNSKGKTTMCVWYKPNISERANNSGQICSFSSHLISVDCLFLQKNTDLSEDTQYRYRPVNLILEPYFLPQPVISCWWWWTMQ